MNAKKDSFGSLSTVELQPRKCNKLLSWHNWEENRNRTNKMRMKSRTGCGPKK